MSSHSAEKDLEAGSEKEYLPQTEVTNHVPFVPEEEISATRAIQNRFKVLGTLQKGEDFIDRYVGIEKQGIDRISEEDKQPPSMWNIFLLWWSLNVHVGVIPLGLLGAEFGLSLKQNIAATIVGSLLGALCTAYDGTLSPKLGLRQIAVSRYSFGFWGAKLCSVLNIIVGGGFFVVNLVVVGQMLSAVSNYSMSITVGIVIIAVVSYVVSIFGYKIIHTYEKYSWIVTFILMLVLVGQVAPHVDSNAPGLDGSSGIAYAGTFLSIIAITFSNASGWCSIAGDYYVHYPADTKRWKIFALTYFGVLIPVTFSITVGCLLGAAAVGTNPYSPYTDAYTDHGLGGLIYTAYHPNSFSKFCLIILTFSVLGNNIAINYSSGLSLQLLGHYFHAIPRFIWTLVFAVVVAVIAIAGREHLSTIVSNFVSLLGYWTVSFTVILLLEDAIFRRRVGYNVKAWDKPAELPWGIAAVFSLLAGYLAGGVTGMAQTWYIGPIAQKFGEDGGDVGIYMSFAITALVYPITRAIEKKYTGR
ncbi:hypothetical protein CBS101457_005080 [Exobasidium rhododendri]|nr:hypothetical protein CBS101457_005080 [Exobasidium rhododendri]